MILSNSITRSRKGFTLIETLIYYSIASMVVAGLASLFFVYRATVVEATNRTATINLVNKNFAKKYLLYAWSNTNSGALEFHNDSDYGKTKSETETYLDKLIALHPGSAGFVHGDFVSVIISKQIWKDTESRDYLFTVKRADKPTDMITFYAKEFRNISDGVVITSASTPGQSVVILKRKVNDGLFVLERTDKDTGKKDYIYLATQVVSDKNFY